MFKKEKCEKCKRMVCFFSLSKKSNFSLSEVKESIRHTRNFIEVQCGGLEARLQTRGLPSQTGTTGGGRVDFSFYP